MQLVFVFLISIFVSEVIFSEASYPFPKEKNFGIVLRTVSNSSSQAIPDPYFGLPTYFDSLSYNVGFIKNIFPNTYLYLGLINNSIIYQPSLINASFREKTLPGYQVEIRYKLYENFYSNRFGDLESSNIFISTGLYKDVSKYYTINRNLYNYLDPYSFSNSNPIFNFGYDQLKVSIEKPFGYSFGLGYEVILGRIGISLQLLKIFQSGNNYFANEVNTRPSFAGNPVFITPQYLLFTKEFYRSSAFEPSNFTQNPLILQYSVVCYFD